MKELQFTPIKNGRMITEKQTRNAKAAEYSNRIRRKHEEARIKFYAGFSIVTGVLALCVAFSGNSGMEARAMETQKESYEVRYGTMNHSSSTIMTEDGNIWILRDSAGFEDGTKVRVLFNTCQTETLEDDIIIDITEKK